MRTPFAAASSTSAIAATMTIAVTSTAMPPPSAAPANTVRAVGSTQSEYARFRGIAILMWRS